MPADYADSLGGASNLGDSFERLTEGGVGESMEGDVAAAAGLFGGEPEGTAAGEVAGRRMVIMPEGEGGNELEQIAGSLKGIASTGLPLGLGTVLTNPIGSKL